VTIQVRTQEELDAAIADGHTNIECVGDGTFTIDGSASVWAYDSVTVRAYGSASVWASGSVTVWASGSVTVRASGSASVWAYDSVTVRASGSASVWASGSASVWASGSASVRAYGSASVWAYDSVTVRASAFVAVHIHGDTPRVDGGVQIRVPHLTDAAAWCNYHDIPGDGETVVLFKAVRDDWRSAHGTSYASGAAPVADDWEPSRSCGGGLHLVARPWEGCRYDSEASRFVACRVRLDEVVVIDVEKVKVPRVLECFEVDIDGEVVS
jgi:hypothetical protein